jgi:hypothetical protein
VRRGDGTLIITDMIEILLINDAQDVKRTKDVLVDMNDRIIIRILVSSCLLIAQFKIR